MSTSPLPKSPFKILRPHHRKRNRSRKQIKSSANTIAIRDWQMTSLEKLIMDFQMLRASYIHKRLTRQSPEPQDVMQINEHNQVLNVKNN